MSLICAQGIPGWQEYVAEANSCHSSDSHILYRNIKTDITQARRSVKFSATSIKYKNFVSNKNFNQT